jgi:MOSC domain-containing protein YiiM
MPTVISVARSIAHDFSKQACPSINLIAGEGVEGDCHRGVTVKHRSRVAVDPTQPNLRQVHLIHVELFSELAQQGYTIEPGQLGENITTRGIDLLSLPKNTVLKIGAHAEIEVTGLRNPCSQIENFRSGLLSKVLVKTEDGKLQRKTGVMGIVLVAGRVTAGDTIEIRLPSGPHIALERV